MQGFLLYSYGFFFFVLDGDIHTIDFYILIGADHNILDAASTTGTGQSLGLEGVYSLAVAHSQLEVTVEVGLGDINLHTINVGAGILGERTTKELAIAL